VLDYMFTSNVRSLRLFQATSANHDDDFLSNYRQAGVIALSLICDICDVCHCMRNDVTSDWQPECLLCLLCRVQLWSIRSSIAIAFQTARIYYSVYFSSVSMLSCKLWPVICWRSEI